MLEALYITIFGMLIVFAALGAVLLVMIVIGILFQEKESENQEE